MKWLIGLSVMLAIQLEAQKPPAPEMNTMRRQQIQRPVVIAGDNQEVRLPYNEVELYCKASSPNGKIKEYLWSRLSGPDRYKIESPQSDRTKVTGLVEGEYWFLIMVTDNREAHAWDTVKVKVLQGKVSKNKPPIVNAGGERYITLPTNRLTLSGKGSDPDGPYVRFRWTKVSGPPSFKILTPESAKTQIVNLSEGIYGFALTAIDTFGRESRDIAIVKVLPPKSKPVYLPSAEAGDDIAITLPRNSVVLSGVGTTSDSSGRITKYKWTEISGETPFQIANPDLAKTEVTGLEAGTYVFQLMVTDNHRATATDYMSVTVKEQPVRPAGKPPIVNAGANSTITLPNKSISLSGSAKDPDPDGYIVSYEWTKVSGPEDHTITSTADSNRTIMVEMLTPGDYVFELKATDNDGVTGTDTVMITLQKKPIGALVWIIITGLGIVAFLSSYYFFFRISPTRKVMVYYMHKDEEELVNSLMPDSIRTEGYAVGECTQSQMKEMKDKKLAIHVLNPDVLLINTPGKTRTLKYSVKKGERKLETDTIDTRPGVNIKNLVSEHHVQAFAADIPDFYIITLDTPLLPEFQEKLERIGLPVIQHVPYNNYIVFVKEPGQLDALRSKDFDFIRLINQYSPADTGLMVREDHFQEAINTDGHLVLDLVLHREEDKHEVFSFLEQHRIQILGSYRNRIRISVSAGLVLTYNLAGNTYIQAIYEYIPPVLHNDVARHIIGIEAEGTDRVVVTETGLGEIIGVADTGIDIDHPDLKSHIIGAVAWGRKDTNDTSDPHGHGTHVTGSIVGDGTASGGKIKGIAPGAKVFFQSLMDDAGSLANFDLKLQELFKEAYNHGARIHNNSWGSAAEARYTIDSTIVDEFIYEHPEMLIVISAGNEGMCNTEQGSEKGYVGFGSVGSPATTKNGLTVGASRSKRTTGGYAAATYGKIWPDRFTDPPTSIEPISGDAESIAAFSSRGRCDDFRMKPDIVAPGTDILSAKSSLAPLSHFHGGYAGYNNAYAFLGGTSMSTPIVSGAAAIVREYYRSKRGYPTPSAALIKATLINGTHKLNGMSAIYKSNMIPNPNQGYGMLDLSMTIPNEQNVFHLEFRDSLQDASINLNITGQEYALRFRTQQVTWIRACLAYTDFPVRSVQNNLDLLMDYEPTRDKWSGNIGINGDDPFASKKEDSTNNMEIIRIDTAQPGLYTVKVFARNLPKGKQGFALVITTGDMNVSFE